MAGSKRPVNPSSESSQHLKEDETPQSLDSEERKNTTKCHSYYLLDQEEVPELGPNRVFSRKVSDGYHSQEVNCARYTLLGEDLIGERGGAVHRDYGGGTRLTINRSKCNLIQNTTKCHSYYSLDQGKVPKLGPNRVFSRKVSDGYHSQEVNCARYTLLSEDLIGERGGALHRDYGGGARITINRPKSNLIQSNIRRDTPASSNDHPNQMLNGGMHLHQFPSTLDSPTPAKSEVQFKQPQFGFWEDEGEASHNRFYRWISNVWKSIKRNVKRVKEKNRCRRCGGHGHYVKKCSKPIDGADGYHSQEVNCARYPLLDKDLIGERGGALHRDYGGGARLIINRSKSNLKQSNIRRDTPASSNDHPNQMLNGGMHLHQFPSTLDSPTPAKSEVQFKQPQFGFWEDEGEASHNRSYRWIRNVWKSIKRNVKRVKEKNRCRRCGGHGHYVKKCSKPIDGAGTTTYAEAHATAKK